MTIKRRREVYAKYGHCCHACGVQQIDGSPRLQIDHWVPLFLGGSEDADNLRPLCERCHKVKTQTENKVRGKINRLSGRTKKERKHKWLSRALESNGRWPKGRKLQSRGFQKHESRA